MLIEYEGQPQGIVKGQPQGIAPTPIKYILHLR